MTAGDGRRRIAVLTTGRQDWGILRSVCLALLDHPDVDLLVVAGGMHLAPQFGLTIELVRGDGVPIAAELAWLGGPGDAQDPPATDQAGHALRLAGEVLRQLRPDMLVLAGDRFETAAAALAATIEQVPIAHLHGGEETLGAFDDSLRHAITKLAHLHLVASEGSARRLRAMGEDPAAIRVVGPPGVDNLYRPDLSDRAELEDLLGTRLEPPVVIVTVHPTTRATDSAIDAQAVVAAMDAVEATYVITLPNADPAGDVVRQRLEDAARGLRRVAVSALGDRRYWGLMRLADAMLGNSSSGILEAPSIGLPTINVGDRQAGRERSPSIVDVPADADGIAAALRAVLAADRHGLSVAPRDPLHDGHAGERCAAILAAWDVPRPPRKPPIPA